MLGKELKFNTREKGTPITGRWRYHDPCGENVGLILSNLCQDMGTDFYVLKATLEIHDGWNEKISMIVKCAHSLIHWF